MSEAMTSLWRPRGAWEGAARIGRPGAAAGPVGIRLSLREGFGLATLIAADGKEAGLRTALADRFGPSLPEVGTAVFEGETGLVWSAPGQWLAVAPSPTRATAAPWCGSQAHRRAPCSPRASRSICIRAPSGRAGWR